MNPTIAEETTPRDGDVDALLVPVLMVAVTRDGVLLPEVGGLPARALDLEDLTGLASLARHGCRLQHPALGDAAARLADELRARGLLIAVTPAEIEPVPARVEAPSVPPRDTHEFVLTTPVILRLGAAGYEHFDHDGRVNLRLSATELLAAAEFRSTLTLPQAWERHVGTARGQHLDEGAFRALVQRLLDARLLQSFDPHDPRQQRTLSRGERDIRHAIVQKHALDTVIARRADAHDAAERAREARTGQRRTPVVPVHFQWQIPPLALGMIVAYAQAHEDGRLCRHYDFRPEWISGDATITAAPHRRAIYLFSHYVWSSAQNLALSARVKAASPTSMTIHGGPDVPKYRADVEAYFRRHPHVDLVVHGEGEETTTAVLSALAPSLDRPHFDLDALATIPGLSFRSGDAVVFTGEGARIVDLDALPSPILTGLFDGFGEAATESIVLESNRGCPYGCTFCDWGSATLSRIRQFSLDRVFEELEWCARHRVRTVGMADANFGIFERDVAIAEKVADLKRRYGYPMHLGLNYAKNSLKHLKSIVKILADGGILSYGLISLQSTDRDTLRTINRSNIKVEKYHEMAQEFRQAGLPLFVDLMMGLPGSTLRSFRQDLQQSVDREVIAKVHPTQLLVNSPMNEPEYRERNRIQVSPGEFVTSSATFTSDDYDDMKRIRRVFLLLEKFGVLRHVARYVRQETGMSELDFFERLWRDARADRARWAVVAFTLEAVPGLMVPPGGWHLFLDETRRYVVGVLGVADDDALATVFAVQHALLPARNRQFPAHLDLRHDYAAWHAAITTAKDAGHLDDWMAVVPRLREFGPAAFTVTDPYDVCVLGIGHTVDADIWGVWELGSPVSRPVMPLHAAID